MERDRVVGALARMHAAGRHVEPDARVGVDALLEIGDADHDVVDAGQHLWLPAAYYHRVPASRRCPGFTQAEYERAFAQGMFDGR